MDELDAKLDGTWEPPVVEEVINPTNLNSTIADMISANDEAGIDFEFPIGR